MIFNYNILAYAGISIVSINLFPQIFLIINNKNADSVSYVTYIMNVISSLLLIIYAFNYELLPILIGTCTATEKILPKNNLIEK
jgi:uncharacterized protein with PQ loop repeat